MTGHCRECGPGEVIADDDGQIMWIECARCGKLVTAMAREDAPLLVRLAAGKIGDG
jgi:ribosomal protein S27AE